MALKQRLLPADRSSKATIAVPSRHVPEKSDHVS